MQIAVESFLAEGRQNTTFNVGLFVSSKPTICYFCERLNRYREGDEGELNRRKLE